MTDEMLERNFADIKTALEVLTASNLALVKMLETSDLFDLKEFIELYKFKLQIIQDNQWLYKNLGSIEDNIIGDYAGDY